MSVYSGEMYTAESAATATAKSLQSCPTLCDPTDGSAPGSPVSGILQARTLEWGAISFSNAWKWKVKRKSLSRIRLLATPWIAAYQAPSFIGFSRQEYWSGVPLPSEPAAILPKSFHFQIKVSWERKRQERNISFSFIFLLQLSPPLCDLGASSPHCLFLSSPYLLFTEGKSSLPLQDPSKEISENSWLMELLSGVLGWGESTISAFSSRSK